MDFSQEVLIDFGLNLAGYLLVLIILYVIVSRRKKETVRESVPETPPAQTDMPQRIVPRPAVAEALEYVSLDAGRPAAVRAEPAARKVISDPEPVKTLTAASRRENRRAIYQQARRMLQQGGSRNDLLDRLPLTEEELEMISATGKA